MAFLGAVVAFLGAVVAFLGAVVVSTIAELAIALSRRISKRSTLAHSDRTVASFLRILDCAVAVSAVA